MERFFTLTRINKTTLLISGAKRSISVTNSLRYSSRLRRTSSRLLKLTRKLRCMTCTVGDRTGGHGTPGGRGATYAEWRDSNQTRGVIGCLTMLRTGRPIRQMVESKRPGDGRRPPDLSLNPDSEVA